MDLKIWRRAKRTREIEARRKRKVTIRTTAINETIKRNWKNALNLIEEVALIDC